MDLTKVSAVKEWPQPTSRKDLQRFLGFANFYSRFLHNYSSIVNPLTNLTSTKTPFLWNQEAEDTFNHLKDRFSSVPVLAPTDPTRQFVVVVLAIRKCSTPFESQKCKTVIQFKSKDTLGNKICFSRKIHFTMCHTKSGKIIKYNSSSHQWFLLFIFYLPLTVCEGYEQKYCFLGLKNSLFVH